jgi:hypothetical protein
MQNEWLSLLTLAAMAVFTFSLSEFHVHFALQALFDRADLRNDLES